MHNHVCESLSSLTLCCTRARSQDDWLSVIWPGGAKSASVAEADLESLEQPLAAQAPPTEGRSAQAGSEKGGAASGLQ